MTKKTHQTLRQRLFPTPDEADEISSRKRKNDGDAYYTDISGSGLLFYRWIRSLFLASVLLYGTYQGIGNTIDYSRGQKTGMINKVSETGLFWKTYEGQMALEGIVSGSLTTSANVWDFSLDRQARHGENTQELVTKLRESMQNETKVMITYTEQFTTWPWRSGTNYFIQNVEPIRKIEKQ